MRSAIAVVLVLVGVVCIGGSSTRRLLAATKYCDTPIFGCTTTGTCHNDGGTCYDPGGITVPFDRRW